MSVPLPIVDMSVYPKGGSGYVTLDNAKQTQPSSSTNSTDKAHLRVFNDSGSHLNVWMDTGDLNEYLPAGGWLTWDIDQTANEFRWTVVNILPNPPVQLMMVTYYKQGETVPAIPTLGNSPIGGAVGTNTNLTSTLSNEGNPAPTLVIDVGDTLFNQLFTLYNDGSCLWAVDQSGVKHQVIKVGNTGRQLLLGQAGDTTEIAGLILVDQGGSIVGGPVTITGNGVGSLHLGDNGTGSILDTTTFTTYIKGPQGVVVQVPAGTTIATFNATGLTLPAGMGVTAPTITGTTSITTARLNVAQSGYDHLSQFSGGGSGSFGTGLSVAPSGIYTNCCSLSGSSQTWGGTIATTCVVTAGIPTSWFGQASH